MGRSRQPILGSMLYGQSRSRPNIGRPPNQRVDVEPSARIATAPLWCERCGGALLPHRHHRAQRRNIPALSAWPAPAVPRADGKNRSPNRPKGRTHRDSPQQGTASVCYRVSGARNAFVGRRRRCLCARNANTEWKCGGGYGSHQFKSSSGAMCAMICPAAGTAVDSAAACAREPALLRGSSMSTSTA